MSDVEAKSEPECYFFSFGLIVTGIGEQKHLPLLFRSLMESGICSFEVIRFINQRSPITSTKRSVKMVGTGKKIPSEDEKDIGLPARRYLAENPCGYVLLIDDLEYDRAPVAQQVFARYRNAFDTILGEDKNRASVHFLVNMLEAYYFAHADAINAVLGTNEKDFEGDVETIRHPKGELKRLVPGFDEVVDGGNILELLSVERVLSRPDTCASLRTLFAWCIKILEKYPIEEIREDLIKSLSNKYRLSDGILSAITKSQLMNL